MCVFWLSDCWNNGTQRIRIAPEISFWEKEAGGKGPHRGQTSFPRKRALHTVLASCLVGDKDRSMTGPMIRAILLPVFYLSLNATSNSQKRKLRMGAKEPLQLLPLWTLLLTIACLCSCSSQVLSTDFTSFLSLASLIYVHLPDKSHHYLRAEFSADTGEPALEPKECTATLSR